MRISDWSSDVCSSDLGDRGCRWHRRCRQRGFPVPWVSPCEAVPNSPTPAQGLCRRTQTEPASYYLPARACSSKPLGSSHDTCDHDLHPHQDQFFSAPPFHFSSSLLALPSLPPLLNT